MYETRSHRRSVATAAAIGMAVLTISACGGGSTDTTIAATTTTTAAPTTTLPAGTVNVTLTDVSSTQMLLTPSPETVPAGTVTFVVTNDGTQEHEFVVTKTDTLAADLPFDATADKAAEEGDGLVHVDEIEGIQPGETKTLVLDLEAGHYVLDCNLKGHYRMGMRADFDVT